MNKQYATKKILSFLGVLILTVCIGCKTVEVTDQPVAAASTVLDYSYPNEMPSVEEILSSETVIEKLIINGQDIDTKSIDRIQDAFPDCEILYDIRIGGETFQNTAKAIETPSFKADDVLKLNRFPNLEYLSAGETDCSMELDEYSKQHPNVKVIYTKSILGVPMRNIDTYLDLSGSSDSMEEIQEALTENPQIQEVSLVYANLDNSAKEKLHESFPDIRFYYMVDVKGTELKSTETRIDFTRVFLDDGIQEVASILHCFMNPEWVDVSRQFFENSDMEWIQEQFPNTQFAWIVPVGKNLNLRTDQEVFNGTESTRVLKTSGIQNLKYCRNLKAVDITAQEIGDISCLADLEKMVYLRIGGNNISDISALKNMKDLKYLEIYGNGISDISALESCESLEDINLNRNQIEDITPLLKLKNLKCIYISQNPVSGNEDAINALKSQFPDAEIVCNRESARGGFADTERSAHVDSIFKGRIYMEEE